MNAAATTILLSIVGAIAGSANDVVVKLVSTIVPSEPEFQFRPFQKPLTISFFLFIGIMLVWYLERPCCHPKAFILILIPSAFMLLQVVLFVGSAIYGKASVCFLIRHTLGIVTPLAITLHKPRGYQFLSIGLVISSTVIAFFSHEGSLWAPAASALSAVFLACQLYSEHRLLEEVEISGPAVIAGEGFWCALITLLIFFPLAYVIPGSDISSIPGGAIENVIDSFKMVFATAKIVLGIILLFFTSFVNSASVFLLKEDRTSISFVISDIFTVILAWVSLLFIGGDQGEILSLKSILQMVALLVYALSSLVFNQIIRFPCFRYSDWTHLSDQEKPLNIDSIEDLNL